MITRKRLLALGSTVLLGVAGVVHADTTSSSDLKAEMAALRARVAELEGRQNEAWLNERRAEEVKTLVKEVLTDADTRASLLEGGLTAGHNGQNFWIGSEDGSFLLKICGQIQVRYYGSFQDNGAPAGVPDQEAGGFEISRAKVEFSGHISSPKFTYTLRLAVDENSNNVYAEKITIGHELMDGLWIVLGEDKAPFLREELVSSANQLAVERSLVNEFFTLGYVQGLWVNWNAHEQFNLSVSINDGSRSGEYDNAAHFIGGTPVKPYQDDGVDFAITARGDLLLMGTWEQLADFTAWSGQDTSLSFGAAIHYQTADDTGLGAFAGGSLFAWTVDGSLEWNGFNLFAAFIGAHFDSRATGVPTVNLYGVVAQGGYQLIADKLEVFARYEWIDFDKGTTGTVEDDVNLATFGINYYINKHATKFTLDVVWAFDPIIASDISLASNSAGRNKTGLRTDATGQDDQVLIRAQMQLLF